jgi:nucleoside-diphosphate-sugar epimerase
VKVLVTGATGFIGTEVAHQIAHRGWRPRLVVRRPPRGRLLGDLDAELVYADLLAPETLARAVEGCDAVLHLGGRATFEPARRLAESFVAGTRNLAEAAASAGVSSFIFASSLLVYPGDGQLITTSTPAAPRIDYGRVKRFVEERLATFGAGTGMAVGSVRLPHVYGATDQLFGRIRRGWVVVPGWGRGKYAHLHVRDAARVLIAAAERGWEGVAPVGDREPVGWRRFLDEIDRSLPGLRVGAVPAPLARAGTEAIALTTGWGSKPSLHTPDTVVAWNLDLPVDPGALWPELGIEPELPTYREGIAATLDDRVAFRWRHPVADTRR